MIYIVVWRPTRAKTVAQNKERRVTVNLVTPCLGATPPITTLRDWEQHRSTPDAPARALLAIERDPKIMRRLLAESGTVKFGFCNVPKVRNKLLVAILRLTRQQAFGAVQSSEPPPM
jgi:hypothetical protein